MSLRLTSFRATSIVVIALVLTFVVGWSDHCKWFGPTTASAQSVSDDAAAPQVAALTNYVFSVANGVGLEDMTGATTIVGNSQDDTVSAVQNIGFDFFFMTSGYNRFCASADGWVRLTNAACVSEFTNSLVSTTNIPRIAPYWDDLATGTTGSVSYKVVGSAPNRKLVVQWFVTVPRVLANPANATFQAWLFEGTGIIQYVYGNGLVANTGNYSVGLTQNSTNFASVTTSTDTNSFVTANNVNTTAITAGKSYSYTPPQTAPSAAPSNLTFTNITPGTVTLNWLDNSVDEDGFPIAISSDGGATYIFIGTAAENSTSVTVTGLLANTTYFFRVFAATEGVATTPAQASVTTGPPISGTKTICASGCDYTTFAAAISDVNAGTGPGGVTFNVTAGQTFPENGSCITGGSSTNPIIFQKSGLGANPIIQPPGSASTQDSGVCILGGDYITFDGIDVAVAAGVTTVEFGYLIFNSSSTNGAQNNTVQNSKITLNRTNTSSIGINQSLSIAATAASGANSNNRYYNITIENVNRGMLLNGTSATFPDSNNEIGVTPGGTTTIGAATANDIGNAAGTLFGINAVNQNAVRIFNATVQNVTGTSTNAYSGIYLNNGSAGTFGTSLIYNNKVSNISKTTATTVGTVYGIRADLSTGNTATVYNNFITGLNQNSPTTAVATIATRGLAANAGTNAGTVNAYFNSVRIDQGAALGYGSAAFYFAGSTTTGGVNTRNNIFSNFTAAQTGVPKHYAYYRFSGVILASSNNDLYIASGTGAATNGFTGFFTSDRATLADWQAAQAGLDANSIAADPQFISPADLHVALASPVVDAGIAVAGIIQDIDGQNRVGNPDIGADEPGGTTPPANDISATAIITPAPNSFVTTGTSVIPQASFTNVGSATQSNVSVQFTITGPGGYNYTNTQNIATIAPNQTVTVTFAAAPAFTTVGTYTSTANVLTPDSNPANDTTSAMFTVFPPVTGGSFNVGTAEGYTSLTNPGGIFDAINQSTVTSNITVNITSDLAGETGTIRLNQVAGGFGVTIQPSGGAARLVSGASATNCLIDINGADNVTIDGLNSGGNSLTFRNTDNTRPTICLRNDASSNTVQNSTVEGGNTTTATTTAGVLSLFDGPTTGNDNNTVTNNMIRDRSDQLGTPATLVFSQGSSATITNTGNTVSNNQLKNFTLNGIQMTGTGNENWTISGNTIFEETQRTSTINGINFASLGTNTITLNTIRDLNTSLSVVGIQLGDARGTTVSRNHIFSIPSTSGSTGTLQGINFTGSSLNPANVTIVNNMVSIVPAFTNSQQIHGIRDFGFGGNTFSSYFNTVLVGGTGLSTGTSDSWACVRGTGAPTAYTMMNNICFNNRTGGTGDHFAAGDQSDATGTFTSDYNIFVGTGTAAAANFFDKGTSSTGTPVNFATWQGQPAPTRDVNSQASNPVGIYTVANMFLSDSNLHLNTMGNNPAIDTGVAAGGVGIDFDGHMRPQSTAPDIGADEVLAPTASAVSITGRVTDASGRGIRNAILILEGGPLLEPRYIATGGFGMYGFEGLPVGTYTVTVNTKRYTFAVPSRVINVVDDITGVDFVAEPQE